MKEVQFKYKHANHKLHIAGKQIRFKDGVAQVTNDVADAIIDLEDDDYTVKPEKTAKPVKPKPKGKGKSRK